mgnify:CR=1 FL=1
MRLTEFEQRVEDEFGPARAGLVADSLHLPGLDTTATAALAAGVDPRRVWLAVFDLHEIPQERRLGRDVPPKR